MGLIKTTTVRHYVQPSNQDLFYCDHSHNGFNGMCAFETNCQHDIEFLILFVIFGDLRLWKTAVSECDTYW